MANINWNRNTPSSRLNSDYYSNPKKGFDAGWHKQQAYLKGLKKTTKPKGIRPKAKVTHLGAPKKTAHIDHQCEIVEVDNIHRWEMRCITCNKHIKWAKEVEYLWLNWSTGEYKKTNCTFRTMYWAPRYDSTYQKLQALLQQEIIKNGDI